MSAFTDLTGRMFGRLTVLERVENSRAGKARWLCRCECGALRTVVAGNLMSGNSATCRCHYKDGRRRPHDTSRGYLLRRPEYTAWYSAKQRCTNPKNRMWPDYGGRGITMCKRWCDSFEAFLADVGPRPGSGYSIDRKDNDGNYEPDNCRWATAKEQANNRRPARIPGS